MGRLMGIEPTNVGTTIRCVNHFATTAIINGRGSRNRTHIKGFGDLRFTIKLYPYKWWWGTDSNRRTQRERIYSPPRLATSLPHQLFYNKYILVYINMPARGLEPPTY